MSKIKSSVYAEVGARVSGSTTDGKLVAQE